MVIKNQAVKFMRGNKPLSQACRPSLLLFTHGFQLVTVISLSVAIRCSPVPQHLLLPRTSLTKCLNKGIEGENRLLEFLSNTSFDITSNLLNPKQDWRSPKKVEIYLLSLQLAEHTLPLQKIVKLCLFTTIRPIYRILNTIHSLLTDS